MELQKKITLSFLIFLGALFVSGNSFANEENTNSFSGFIMVGGAYTSGKMALDETLDNKNKKIDSLSQNSKSFDEVIPFITGSLSYNIVSTGTSVSIGSEGDGFGLSLFQYGGDLGNFIAGVSYSKDEEYQDPFLTGVKRKKTDVTGVYYNFGWENIFSKNLSLSYCLTTIDPDKDEAGKRNKKLKRDGNIHSFGAGFDIYNSALNTVSAEITYDLADISGESNSFKGPGLELSYTISKEKWELETGISFSVHDYDEVHPEFNKTRHEKEGSIGTAYTLKAPFGMENWFVQSSVHYSKIDSNIDFYDSSAVITFFGVGYSF